MMMTHINQRFSFLIIHLQINFLKMITSIDENETQLLRQPFMLNPQQTIYDYLDSHGANVTDFIRIELGKTNGN